MRRLAALLLCIPMLLLPACAAAAGPPEPDSEFLLYYNAFSSAYTGSALLGEPADLEDLAVDSVMNALLSGPQDTSTYASTFPSGTTLNGWELEDGLLTLDLSESFSRLSGISLIRAEYCIVLTMTQLEEVSAVSILVDGAELPGSVAGVLTAEDVVLNGETEDPVLVGSQLYFPLTDGSGLGVEYREMELRDSAVTTQAQAVLDQLVSGTDQTEMISFLTNAGTLEASEVTDGCCTVSMDSQTMSCFAGEENFDLIALYALVDSLTELEGIDAVSFRLDGAEINGWDELYTAVYEF